MPSRAQLTMKEAALKPWRRECDAVSLVLPFPTSVNSMFNDGDIGHGKRPITPEYKAWRFQAELEIMRQRCGCVQGPVEVTLAFEDKPGRRDLDNLIKGPLDMLVHMGVIDGDSSKTVRKITATWCASAQGARVEIRRHIDVQAVDAKLT